MALNLIDTEIVKILIQNLPAIITSLFMGIATVIAALWSGYKAKGAIKAAEKSEQQSLDNSFALKDHNKEVMDEVKQVKKIVNGNTEKLIQDSKELYHLKETEKEKEG